MLLHQVLVDYYAPLTRISERTQRLYDYTIRAFGEVLGRPAETTDLEELTVARFLAHRVRTKAAATAGKDRAQLHALWEFCARRKLADTWPQVPRIVIPERVPEAWLTEEFERILASAQQETEIICGFPASKVWRAILLTCYWTAERITPVMELRCRDVRGTHVIFRAENRKGSIRDILREVSVECADALLAVRRGPDDTAIPWDKPQTSTYNRLKVILKRAGLPTDRKSKFHRIRKTAASYYEAAGGDAQEFLDHSSRKVTKKYLDPRIVKPKLLATDVLPKVG